MTRGLTFITAYTYSKNLEQISFLNAQDAEPSRELASYDRTHRLALSGLWELPVGRNRWLFRHANGAEACGVLRAVHAHLICSAE